MLIIESVSLEKLLCLLIILLLLEVFCCVRGHTWRILSNHVKTYDSENDTILISYSLIIEKVQSGEARYYRHVI